jgi:predicted nucleic acid-binding protein
VTQRRRDRVFVDANELFPFAVMDVVLALAEDLVIDFVWSDELLAEWQRVIVREGKRTPESAASVAHAVQHFFRSGRIDPDTYRNHVANTPGTDPDDRIHTAAAIGGNATVLLTKNQRDFPAEHLHQHGVTLTSSDAYLRDLLRRRPADVIASVRQLAAEKTNPPRTPCDLVDGLRRAGAVAFAERLGTRLGC